MAVQVQVQAHVASVFDFADQLIRRHRRENAGHIA